MTTEAVIAEVVYVLSSPRLPYQLAHAAIRVRLIPLLTLRGVRLRGKRTLLRALDIYASYPHLDFEDADALSIAYMERHGIAELISYDQDFDRIPGVRRVEP